MAKYNKTTVQKIVNLIEEGFLSISEICKQVGVSRKMFYEWKAEKPDFKNAIDEALEALDEKLRYRSRRAMMYKMGGCKQVETKTIYTASEDDSSGMVIKQHVVKERYLVPEVSDKLLNDGDREDFVSESPRYLRIKQN